MMNGLVRDLRIALRKLGRDPLYALVTITVLGVSIGANTAMFSVINPLVLEALPYERPDRVVGIFTTNQESGDEYRPLPWVDYRAIERQVNGLSELAGFRAGFVNLSGPAEPTRARVAEVTGSFFPLLGVQAERGRVFGEEERRLERRVAVISPRLRERIFADRNPLDRTILLDGQPYDVIGVGPADLILPSPEVDVWVPLQLTAEERQAGRFVLDAFGRLASDVTREQVEQQLAGLATHLAVSYPRTRDGQGFRTLSLHEVLYGREFQNAVAIFLLAILFVHLIAVANVAGLLFIRATVQEHELLLRNALGAGRMVILRLFIAEAVVLCSAAAVVGVLLGSLGTHFLLLMLPRDLPRIENVAVDAGVLVFTVLLAMVTAGVCVAAPVTLVRRRSAASPLNEHGRTNRGGRRRRRIQRVMVAGEIALACVLLVASLLLIRSFENLRNTEPGFDQERLLTFQVSPRNDPTVAAGYAERLQVLYEQLAQDLAAIPSVVAVTFASELPGESASGSRFAIIGQASQANRRGPVADLVVVGPDYFSSLGIPLLAGRPLGRQDAATATPVAVVNRTFVSRYLQSSDPMTRTLQFDDREWLVVGVAGDIRQGGLEDPVYPTIYVYHQQRSTPLDGITVAVRAAKAEPLLLMEPVRQAAARVLPAVPMYRITTMETVLSNDIAGTWTMSRLLAFFAGVAWLLAATGIYGVMAYSVKQRLHEIGIRLAVGADRNSIVRLVLREGLTLAVLGVVPGILGATVVSRLLTNWVHGLAPFDLISVGWTSLALAVTAILASLAASRRALGVNPARLLSAQ